MLNQEYSRTVCRDKTTNEKTSDTGVVATAESVRSRDLSLSLQTRLGSNEITLNLRNSELCPAVDTPRIKINVEDMQDGQFEAQPRGLSIKAVKEVKK